MMASVSELLKDSLNELIKDQLKEFRWELKSHYGISASELENADVLDTVDKIVEYHGPEEAVKVTLNILRKMNQNHLAELLENKHKEGAAKVESKAVERDYSEFSNRLKNLLKQEYERILDGNSESSHLKYLNDIYTDLYIVENETGGAMSEHEMRNIELNLNKTVAEETQMKCNDIFKVQCDTGRRNRKVLTMGIAGVGKTVSVNKFILDWAEGKENQEVIFIFPFPFRQLNLIQEDCSLMELIHEYFSCAKQLSSLPEEEGKVMFIFDGLDECRFPLTFKKSERLTDVHEKTRVDVIVMNLIQKNLLPSALIWITSRPAAAHLIPRRHIHQVTEVRGFNDEQKKKYFTKNSSADVSERIISHIKRSRSLYIMCHIPVFCWISLSVLQPLLARETLDKIPTTLTGMYVYFLLSQKEQMTKKYSDDLPKSFEDVVLKLGKLAFIQLLKGNLIFYKEDLKESGLDVREGLVFSGLCTQIFHTEKPVSGRKVYSFVHLSVQEFLAALYVLFIYKVKKTNVFPLTLAEKLIWNFKNSLFDLHRTGIKNALRSKNGQLDLLLRFLMGLSLESNQNELKDLLPSLKITSEDMRQTAEYIKMIINNWSALVFVLLMSEETQEMFELQKYRGSDEALIRLLPVIRNTRRALLQSCNVTGKCCESLSSCLQSSTSLRELDLSNNDLKDSGVKLISDALKTHNCQLHTLRLSGCNVTDECCESLSSCLQSSTSLRELDLSNNDLKDSGVKLISDALKTHNCQLHTLRLSGCMVTDEGCCYLASALSSNPSHLRELDLSYNHPQHSALQLLSDRLNDPNYTLNTLNLAHEGRFRITAGLHKYACDLTLDPNTANTRLILSEKNKKITLVEERQSYPDHPDRFDHRPQVLCRQSLTGRCYWEAEWSGSDVHISVAYKSINRKGWVDSEFGHNDKSWSLQCSDNRFIACHKNNAKFISAASRSSKRAGVYVDWSAGTVSFYSVSDTHKLTHLHTFYTTFTEPLYAGLGGFQLGSSMSLCKMGTVKKQPGKQMKSALRA
ncbi:putative NACHT [Triplophysa rosa]|uniref:NACHT n=1 Tax=Triplophysa rosa TaxID=992332 RepID=A0A9W7WLP3_TRIRA|nr:putative NACHT [Triplophysa rosa]